MELSTPYCVITENALVRLAADQGRYFSPLMGISPEKYAADVLDPRKAEEMAEVLEEYVALRGKRVLEIGAGCGVTHIVWSKKFAIDGWGVEPEATGFGSSASVARELLAANGLDTARIVNARGEKLPFGDASFEIVYSSNVLEHVDDPAQVLREAVRVLKPGGTLQIVCPNYLSYFDGHYAALHPPVLWKWLFIWWLKLVYRKDTAFAETLRTEVNAVWVRRQLAEMPLEIHSLGEAKFVERMRGAPVQSRGSMGVVMRWVALGRKLGLNGVLARVIVALRGWTPLIITATKKA